MSSAVWAVALKDMRAIRSNLQVWLPMLIVPLVIGVLVPGGLLLAVLKFGNAQQLAELSALVKRLPPGRLSNELTALGSLNLQVAFVLANYMLAPFFLLIPLMASSTISADSMAGEKERGTLESLLYSPITVTELFVGKSLAALLPALALTGGTFLLTAFTVNAVGWSEFGGAFFPTLNWAPLLLLVIPLLAVAVVFLNVFISARVRTFQAAYQIGGLVVLPAMALVVGQAAGVLLLGTSAILLIALALLLLDVVLLLLLRRFLDRPQLFESQVA